MRNPKVGHALNIIFPGLGTLYVNKSTGFIQLALTLAAYFFAFWGASVLANTDLGDALPYFLITYLFFVTSLVWSLYQTGVLVEKGKDIFTAYLAFALSLGHMIPLFNIGLVALSLYLAVKALRLRSSHPKKIGGFYYALIALVLDISAILATIFGLTIYVMQKVFGTQLVP